MFRMSDVVLAMSNCQPSYLQTLIRPPVQMKLRSSSLITIYGDSKNRGNALGWGYTCFLNVALIFLIKKIISYKKDEHF